MSDTAETGTASAETGPGRMLERLRTERKLSVADVAQRLKYGARQIEALEAEEFERLPGATFVRGMVRGYAKLLDTDPDPLLVALDRRYVPSEVDLDLRDRGIPFARSGKRGTRTYFFLSVLVLLVIAGVLYEWRAGALPWARLASSALPPQKQAKPRPEPVAAPRTEAELRAVPPAVAAEPAKAPETAAPAPQLQPRTQPQVSGGEGRIRLEFAGESWVEIRDKDGQMLMSQLNPTGSRRVLSGRTPLSLVIGNATNVRLVYNDKPVDLKPYIQIEVARVTLN